MNTDSDSITTTLPDSTDEIPVGSPPQRHLTPAERILGLVVGHLYKVDGTPDDTSLVVFIKDIEHLPAWNSDPAPNTAEDLMVKLQYSPITDISSNADITTAGNVYDPDDPNTSGPAHLNAALLNRPDTLSFLPNDTTWFTQPADKLSPLTPVPDVAKALKNANVTTVPVPKS